MGQIMIQKVVAKFIYDGKEEVVSLLLDQDREGREIFGIDTDDGREVYLYAEEIEAVFQMYERIRELNSQD